MSTLQSRTLQAPAQVAEADLATRIAALFQRCPMLAGFSIQVAADVTRGRVAVQLGARLVIADVAISTWPGFHASESLHAEIAEAVLDLLAERPEAAEILAGRTFARAIH